MSINVLSIRDISKSYGSRQILDKVNFGMNSKAKIGLVGSNGSGKSTLIKIILGLDEPDKGEVHRNKSIKFGYLAQEPQFEDESSLFEIVLSDQKKILNLLKRFEKISLEIAEDPSKLKQLEDLQLELEACDAWNVENEVRQSLALMGFRDLNRPIAGLSGGEQKKLPWHDYSCKSQILCYSMNRPIIWILKQSNGLKIDYKNLREHFY